MVTANTSNSQIKTRVRRAEEIPPVDRHEATEIATFELEQVLNLLEQLEGDDWQYPTECSEWDVQKMTAHLAGGCAGWATWRDFRRQIILNPYLLKADISVDAINRREVEDRVEKMPQELIEELRVVGPKATRNRKNLPGVLRRIRILAKPMPGKISMAYLVDVVYPRDQWMHRMDICRATGKTWVRNPDHDRRLLDLIMLDVAKKLNGRLSLIVNITGDINTSYRFGNEDPQAQLDIDFVTFNRRSSERLTPEEAIDMVQIHGDRAVAEEFLHHCEVLY